MNASQCVFHASDLADQSASVCRKPVAALTCFTPPGTTIDASRDSLAREQMASASYWIRKGVSRSVLGSRRNPAANGHARPRSDFFTCLIGAAENYVIAWCIQVRTG